jgi:RNA polymerase sigma-70 factor (ECF subfamily)
MPPGCTARPDPGARAAFATTQWSLVVAAAERGTAQADEALARLCSLYWYPVFAFVRRQGHSSDEAQDLTQGFFARLIEKGDLGDADRSRGRFRTFLLTACRHFLSNERDRERARKRGGGQAPIPLDVAAAESRYQKTLSHSETPERLYERQWCLTLLAGVVGDLRQEYAASGRERVFERLKDYLTAGESAAPYADAARELAMAEGAVKVAVHRLRRRYRDALRQRVADTVASHVDVDDEIRHLLQMLGGSGTSGVTGSD